MKSIYFLLIILIISCNKREEQKPFIVSEFNRNLEKHFEESKKKDSSIILINDIQLFDYPKGKLNFIFTKDNNIHYYQEDIIDGFCGAVIEQSGKIKRALSKDSLHLIKYPDIIKLLRISKNKNGFNNNWKEMHPIVFIFENDTISNYDIQKLLTDIDNLGYHRYNVRRIAPFEKVTLK